MSPVAFAVLKFLSLTVGAVIAHELRYAILLLIFIAVTFTLYVVRVCLGAFCFSIDFSLSLIEMIVGDLILPPLIHTFNVSFQITHLTNFVYFNMFRSLSLSFSLSLTIMFRP